MDDSEWTRRAIEDWDAIFASSARGSLLIATIEAVDVIVADPATAWSSATPVSLPREPHDECRETTVQGELKIYWALRAGQPVGFVGFDVD